jgi:hypothetical protein
MALVGHLQNKAKLLGAFELIHGLDDRELAFDRRRRAK